ncbi:Methionine synthase vitamin-B12 independent [Thermodesulfatator indicus DSM 15286]|uniref:Methionine synthase vitamin-B12 independent n=1 Tax=Thermodesulfatator indicus (strain DSM 15286 / JCM 11887 / CIR29812) TaxID=667014 RepID=F8A7Y9_THEID|nr:methionine synthase vitamin-B12 independent [Thermodesulfatator indicus]AEH43905.1 Methionine synthase vitamin-B12 independent [Thermodesulfatator indicus DSM 15286]
MFIGRAFPTIVGSFPGKDHEKAVKLVLKYCPEIPCWPQLPAYPQEGMLIQFSKGLPGFNPEKLILDPTDANFEPQMLQFYEEYLAVKEAGKPVTESFFALTPEEARGLFCLKEKLAGAKPLAVKGQVTGPFTLATGLKTPDGKACFYDSTLRDIITKQVALKAAFQVDLLKELEVPVIIFLDEPALAGFGSSSFVGVSREEVLAVLGEVAEEIKARGGIVGVHVCANTEWDLLVEAGIDILNFDAFDYLDRFLLYTKDIVTLLNKKGNIAWGIIPTLKPEALKESSAESLAKQLENAFEKLTKEGSLSIQQVVEQAIITPSCGMGTLPEDLVEQALSLLKEVSSILR